MQFCVLVGGYRDIGYFGRDNVSIVIMFHRDESWNGLVLKRCVFLCVSEELFCWGRGWTCKRYSRWERGSAVGWTEQL
jgi:hypothetical protein